MRHRGGFLCWLPPVKPEDTQLVAPDTAAFWNLPGLTNRGPIAAPLRAARESFAGLIRSEPHPGGPQRSPDQHRRPPAVLLKRAAPTISVSQNYLPKSHLFTSRRPTPLRSKVCLAHSLPPLLTEVPLRTPDTNPPQPGTDQGLSRGRSPAPTDHPPTENPDRRHRSAHLRAHPNTQTRLAGHMP